MLIKNPFSNEKSVFTGSHSDSFWTSEFVPIKGTYNNYGSVENCDIVDSLNWLIWQYTINERSVEIDTDGKIQRFRGYVSLDLLLDVLREGCLFFDFKKFDGNHVLPVRQTMIREDVYQELLKLKIKEPRIPEYSPSSPSSIYEDGLSFYSKEKHDLSCFWLHGLYGRNDGYHLSIYDKWIKNKFFDVKSEKFKILIKDMAEWMYIQHLMESMRKTWNLGSGTGQDYEIQIHIDYFNSMSSVAKKIINKNLE